MSTLVKGALLLPIIPASHFRNEPPKPVIQPSTGDRAEKSTAEISSIEVTKPKTVSPTPAPVEKPKIALKKLDINQPKQRVSGLSLSSLRAKKQHELNRQEQEEKPENLPKDAFTEADMQRHWDDFVEKIKGEGKHILASNLNTDVPKMKNAETIWIELPNETMKKEIERDQYDLMVYLRQKLNNYSVNLYITINEETAKKYAFTPQEKYEKMREKNPAIEKLRRGFDLEI